jgi:hypothetical protein
MRDDDRLLCRLMPYLVLPPITTACALRYVTPDFAMVTITWTTVPIAVGISFGCGVLNEP